MSDSASQSDLGLGGNIFHRLSASQARDLYVTPEPEDNVTTILRELEIERRLFNIPIIIFLVLMAGFGISGNVCVLHVYRTRFRKTAGSFFIMALAILDMLSAALCIPFDIFDLSYPYTHPAPVACRIFRFIEYFTTVAAGLTLTCVAFSRYFKIVNPFHLYSAGQARSLVIVTVAMALSVCWPQLLLSGSRTVPTRVPGVQGKDCNISDGAARSPYPLIFFSVLLALFFFCFSLMVAFYARICCVVWKRSRTRIGEHIPSARPHRTNHQNTARVRHWDADVTRQGGRPSSTLHEPQFHGNTGTTEGSITSSQLSISTISKPFIPRWVKSYGQPPLPTTTKRRRSRPPSHLGRTTRMLGLVTGVALLGYVPFLTVQVVWLVGAGFQLDTAGGYSQELAFQFCLKSHYLSSAANPLIYSVLSPNFRKESMVALKKFLTSPLATLFRNCRD